MTPAHAEAAPADDGAARVRRRHVFYLSGFDPQGPAHYHRLYADEAAKQSQVGGFAIDVGPRRRVGPQASSWAVDARWPQAPAVQTTVEFLRWDDIVRAHWPRSRWAVMLSALATTAAQLRNGVLWRILKTSWPAFLVLILPPLLVLGLLLGLGLACGLAVFVARQGAVLLALALAGASLFALAGFARWAEGRVQMAWLMRSTRFILRQARGQTPDLEARLDDFAHRIDAVQRSGEVDEVLVVGHSSGAMLAISALARTLRTRPAAAQALFPPAPGAPAVLALLTLGECVPMLSYQPEARAFRAEIATLAQADVDWVDFTAPPDGCCFALVDPTAACEQRAGAVGWRSPKRLSPRFAQLFSATAYRAIRRDKYRCHFQYLMSAERPGDYDYFAITAGPEFLASRFRGMASVENFRDFQCFGGPGT